MSVHSVDPADALPPQRSTNRPPATGHRYAVSSGHMLATLAASRILDNGGNAVDAGVAAGMALGVLQPDLVGFTGVAPIITYLAEQDRVVTISGLGRWPKAATLDYFHKHHDGKLPMGVMRTVVPASIDAWVTALQEFGTKTFEEAAQGSLSLARDGFAAYPLLCQTISESLEDFSQWPSNAEIFLPEGRAPQVGDVFLQKDLGRTIQRLIDAERQARGGRVAGLEAVRKCFYEGEIARDILSFYEREGGWLSAVDMKEFRVGLEEPQTVKFHGYDVYSCGAWCQGPLLLEFLKLLEGDDLVALGRNSPRYIHLVTEAMKLGFADREAYFGDPDFMDVPLDILLSSDYARRRRAGISLDKAATELPLPGEVGRVRPWLGAKAAASGKGGRDTTYLCVVDEKGNAFSATPSDGYSGTPVVPGLGFAVSDRGSQSRLEPGHPSAIGPWRRPRLTPNPALAKKDGRIAMVFGTPGGDVQCQAMLQVFLNMAVFGMNPQEAIESPRFFCAGFPNSFYPHASGPMKLQLEWPLASLAPELQKKQHSTDVWPYLNWRGGGVCGIAIDPATNYRIAGADPRRECYALAW
jgi:gamma-glutamyltranspeptidase/glutathione hydrolase